MIRKDKKLSNIFEKDIFYILNYKKLNVIEHFSKESNCENGTCELLLVEYKNEYYLFGANANTHYVGFKIDKDKFINAKDKYYYYDKFFI